ncbi:MAG: gamma-glutamyltransferase family protein [Candidatus Riflebacteria bacterium]|nr:gamma-glutamyltransferase family protein [Candidatus Riflebacteria bacterium]
MLLVLWLAWSEPAAASGARARNGMVATDHELASAAAVEVLRDGGHAVDAMVAAAYVLGVVNPQSSGLGGGGFMLIHDAARGRVSALEFRDRAPREAPRALAALDGRPARTGGLAAAVPCEAQGLEAAWQRFGRLPRRRLLEPALRLAREGFPAGRLLANMARDYLRGSERTPELDRFLTRPDGRRLRQGDRLRQVDLAQTLEAVARDGPRAVTQGPIADAIVRAVRSHGGVLSLQDLQAIEPHWVEPLRGRYRGADVFAMPPPASGAVLLMTLGLLEPTPLPSLGPGSPTEAVAVARALQAATAAKAAYLGDPAFSEIPLERFLTRPAAFAPTPEQAAGDDAEPSDTTNLCIVDREGNAVAMTTSLGAAFGCHLRVEGAGLILSNHVADFSPAPGRPNAYGIPYGRANVVEPLKAPVSASAPTLVFREGRLQLAIGGSGSGRILPAITQCVIGLLDHGLSPERAVALPRLQVTGRSSKIWVEEAYPDLTVRALRLRGLRVMPGVKRASVTAVAVRDGWLLGGSDPRKAGVPMGY